MGTTETDRKQIFAGARYIEGFIHFDGMEAWLPSQMGWRVDRPTRVDIGDEVQSGGNFVHREESRTSRKARLLAIMVGVTYP